MKNFGRVWGNLFGSHAWSCQVHNIIQSTTIKFIPQVITVSPLEASCVLPNPIPTDATTNNIFAKMGFGIKQRHRKEVKLWVIKSASKVKTHS